MSTLQDELRRASNMSRILFVQLGHSGRDERDALAKELNQFESVDSFIEADPRPSAAIVFGVERLSPTHARAGELRLTAQMWAEMGGYVVLVSRRPVCSFVVGPGSDVVAESRQVFLVDAADEPSCCENLDQHLAECLSELGSGVLHTLATAIWDRSLSPGELLLGLSRGHSAALRGAGLLVESGGSFALAPWLKFSRLREVVALCDSQLIETSVPVGDVLRDMWIIERCVRNAIRREFVGRSGNGWRSSLGSPELTARILGRAQAGAHPGAASIKEVRDPLEWLSLGELLDLREGAGLGPLGMSPAFWASLKREVAPIRNSVAHMRLIGESEASEASRWRKIAVEKFGA